MAGKNEVTLTFAGDADKLEKTVKQVKSGGAELESAFERVGAAAKGMDSSLSGIGGSTDRLAKIVGKGGGDFRRYGSDLDGVGDGFNDLEDRAMGAGNILNGVNDMMTAQDPATYAMGLSDLAAGIRYTVVPTLQDGAKGLKNIVTQMGGMKGMLVGGGVLAGVGALAFGLKQLDENRAAKRLEEINEQLVETGSLSDSTAEKMLGIAAETGNFDKLLQQVADVGGLKAAERLVEQAELLGGNKASMAALNEELAKLTEEENVLGGAFREVVEPAEEAREKIDAFSTSIDILLGKQFSVQESQDTLAQSLIDIRDQFAAQTEELGRHGLALTGDSAAALANREQLRGIVEDGAAVLQSMQEQGASGAELRAERDRQIMNLIALRDEYGLNTGAVQTHINALLGIPLTRETTINLLDNASGPLGWIGARIDALPTVKDILIRFGVEGNVPGPASWFGSTGGVVYAAGGHPGVARGTDTVPAWLTPGEMVLNKKQQGNLFDAIDSGALGGPAAGGWGGNTYVTVQVAGSIRSDRDLVKVIRDEIERGGMRGVRR